jgi:hypothetical protein
MGVSGNRKFVNIHGEVNEFIHYTQNPYSVDDRKIYIRCPSPRMYLTNWREDDGTYYYLE